MEGNQVPDTNNSVLGGLRGLPPVTTTRDRDRGMLLSPSNIIRSPLSALLEYSGILRHHHHPNTHIQQHNPNTNDDDDNRGGGGGEVSIRIIGPSDSEHHHREQQQQHISSPPPGFVAGLTPLSTLAASPDNNTNSNVNVNVNSNAAHDAEAGNGGRDSSYQRYDIQHAARWLEQILPFSLLLLLVFIRQHLQGFFVTIWIAAVLFKSNDILRKQTALKGERKMPVLIGLSIAFALHVVGVYWWYQNDDLVYPLAMLPPKDIPPFWHAIFIIMVNDILVRQAAMVFKCILLMYFKNSRGRNYRKQVGNILDGFFLGLSISFIITNMPLLSPGQMLTLVEYLLLLYRALLPTPVWYRFFLNKEYGSLFSSLMTGLYLTFKLTSVVEKVQSFFASVKALSRKEVHYGAYATSEQVNAAGDLCAICQEKMHAPVLLRCKHIFCEDCVSEWFERERTCPLCRALVKPADLRSFGDGSTSLFLQFF